MLKTIEVEKLRVGMYLHDLEASWLKNPFWRTSRLLTEELDIERVKESGIRSAIIDVSKGIDLDVAPEAAAPLDAERVSDAVMLTKAKPISAQDVPPMPTLVPLDVELARAAQICAHSRAAVIRMFSEARMGAALPVIDSS